MRIVAKVYTWWYRVIGRFRQEQSGQVTVLAGVMVFFIAIMAISTLNTSTAIYNKMRVQNSADAAADAFAVWQARGLNTAQHLNDLHYYINWGTYIGETVGCGARIACGPLTLLNLIPFCAPCGTTACKVCDAIASNICKYSDKIQHWASTAILGVQKFLNYAMPVSGFVVANKLAEVNGADPIGGVLGDNIGDLTSALSNLLGVDVSFVGDFLGEILGGIDQLLGFHIIPLTISEKALTLNIAEKDPKPTGAPWKLQESVMTSIVTLGDVSVAFCAGSPIINQYGGDDKWGWDDTFYCGKPAYTTWLAGKKRLDFVGGLRKNAWLNPERNSVEDAEDELWFRDNYGTFHKPDYSPDGDTRPLNPPLMALASSQVEGSPLVERSDGDDWEAYSTPRLISVHIGSDNPKDLSAFMIWH